MNRLAVLALRGILILLFLGTLFGQIAIIPIAAQDLRNESADLVPWAIPYALLWISAIVCVQLVLVSIWALLSMVRRSAIFNERAFRWVDAIIVATAVATSLVFAFEIHLLGIMDKGEPPLGMFLTGVVIAGTALVLLMIVMRGLLRTATALESELREVV